MSDGAVVACPRCRVGLHVGTTRSGPIYGCGRCGGVWLDHAMSRRLTQALDSDTLALADAAALHARTPLENPAAAIGCPRCGATLARHQVANARVEVDFCSTHGTWFDRDELQKVARTFAASRAYGGPGGTAAALAGGAVLGTTVGAAGLGAAYGQSPDAVEQRMQQAEQGSETAAEVGGEALDAGLEILGSGFDVAEGASGALELAGSALEILGGIFEGLG
jgi:Zn-finger nucleic acid-binding protein